MRPAVALVTIATALAASALLGSCGGPRPAASATTSVTTTSAPTPTVPPTTVAPTTVAPTTVAPTTRPTTRPATTVPPTTTSPAQWRPANPGASPYAATDQMLSAWQGHDRAAALAVASPAAVKALFVLGYPSAGLLQDGCSTPPGTGPSVCTYRYGITQDLLSVSVTYFATGWGVTGVALES